MNQPQQQPKLPTFSEYIRDIPFFYRLLAFSLILTNILDIFTNIPINLFPNCLKFTIYSFQIWRPIFCFLFESSALIIMFVNINLYTFLPKLQNKYGTVITATNFILTNLLIQMLVLITQGFYKLSTNHYYGCNGILGIWLNLIYKFCYYNPSEMKLCCFGIKITRKIYPFLMFLIISLIQWQIRLQSIIGIVLAVIQCYSFKGSFFNLNFNTYIKIQQILQKTKITNLDCWIILAMNMQPDDNIFFGNLLEGVQGFQKLQPNKNQTDSFAGKRGVRLSDADS